MNNLNLNETDSEINESDMETYEHLVYNDPATFKKWVAFPHGNGAHILIKRMLRSSSNKEQEQRNTRILYSDTSLNEFFILTSCGDI